MILRTLIFLVPFMGTVSRSAEAEPSYTIIVSEAAKSDSAWAEVVDALQRKYPQAAQITWTKDVSESLSALANQHPKFSCFVAKPSEVTREYVASVHQITRRLDQDPYCDTLWGILTGYDAANAKRIATQQEDLTIQRVSSGTEVALSMCKEGVWYDELEQYKKVEKRRGGSVTQQVGPGDTTRVLADSLSQPETHLFVTSGHATERNWQIGFRYKNGYFQSKAGQMFGKTTDNEQFRIHSETAKVYLAVGNCLMGHIDGPDAMALAWLNDVGMNQMLGYTVLTWYGYSGWGVLDYFVEQPGRYSLTEAFHANQHALIHRIHRYFPKLTNYQLEAGSRNLPSVNPTQEGERLGLTSFDSRGLLWDRDTVAFYGDPAWTATMAEMPKAYDQNLTIENNLYTLTITPNLDGRSFEAINTNGSQRGGRPILHYLPTRVENIEILSGQELQPVIADDFILIPNHLAKSNQKNLRVQFRASPVR